MSSDIFIVRARSCSAAQSHMIEVDLFNDFFFFFFCSCLISGELSWQKNKKNSYFISVLLNDKFFTDIFGPGDRYITTVGYC